MPNTEVEMLAGEPEQGDVYSSNTGRHLGNIATEDFEETVPSLHLQVLHEGKWYCYQLVAVEQFKGEQDVSR